MQPWDVVAVVGICCGAIVVLPVALGALLWRSHRTGRALQQHPEETIVSWAKERGYEYLRVDASEDSRPILQKLGLHGVTTTTPYNWTP